MLRNATTDLLAVVSTTGRLLVFPLTQLPSLTKGKGYKLMSVPAMPGNSPHRTIAALACLQVDKPLTLYCGQRHLTLKTADVARYIGHRGQRGGKLPRGFQRVDRLEVSDPQTPVTL
jgi:topoisomerase-4 subunit A